MIKIYFNLYVFMYVRVTAELEYQMYNTLSSCPM